MNAVLKLATLAHYQAVERDARAYTVENLNIPGSPNDIAWRGWADKQRPTVRAVLDWIDTEWEQRFGKGDDGIDQAVDFYADEYDRAEAELWRLNREAASRQ